MTKALYGLAALAAVGFAVSVLVHGGTWAGVAPPPYSWALHVGVLVVGAPTAFVFWGLAREARPAERWQAALRGAPRWTPPLLVSLMLYAIANFLAFRSRIATAPPGAADLLQARGFSGHWMLFYAAAASTLFSAARLRERGE